MIIIIFLQAVIRFYGMSTRIGLCNAKVSQYLLQAVIQFYGMSTLVGLCNAKDSQYLLQAVTWFQVTNDDNHL